MPDRLSLGLSVTVTSLSVALVLALVLGLVASRLIVTLWLLVPPVLVASQVNVTPLVSPVMFCSSQPVWLVIGVSLSRTLQVRVTSSVYQPLSPSVPSMVGVMIGGESSTGR